jgi:hypothetical protein
MDGSGLLALDQLTQAQVDGVLDRRLSLAKNRIGALSLNDDAVLGHRR